MRKKEKQEAKGLLKRLLCVLLVMMLAGSVTACGNSGGSSKDDEEAEEETGEDAFLGTWIWDEDDPTCLVLEEDGEGVYNDGSDEYDIEWKLKGEKVTFKADGEKYTCTLKGKKLKLKSESGNIDISLEKKKKSSGKNKKGAEEDDVSEDIPEINTASGGVGDLLGKVVSEPKPENETVAEMPAPTDTQETDLDNLTPDSGNSGDSGAAAGEEEINVTVVEEYPFGTLYDVEDDTFCLFANDTRSTVFLVPKGFGVAQDEDKLYYIGEDYEEGFAYIPYIFVGKFNAQGDIPAFINDFTKNAMAADRQDFTAGEIEETGDLLENGSMSYGIEYTYTVSGYLVKDYRYFFEKDGILWMVGLKDVDDYSEDMATYTMYVLSSVVVSEDLAEILP